MAEASSLKLLKGGNKAALAKELEAKETAKMAAKAAVQEEVTEVDLTADDIKAMDAKTLDKTIKSVGLAAPDGWAKMKLDAKRAWLLSQFDETGEEAPAEPEPPKGKITFGKKKGDDAKPAKAAGKPAKAAKEEAAPEPKPAKAAAKKATGTAVATSDVKHGEILEKTALSDIGIEIEKMDEEETRAAVAALAEEVDQSYFKLGGVLSRILENHWYTPYASFREFVEQEHDITYRTAMYWINIYTSLVEAEIPYDKVTGIGWSKLKELAPILNNKNVNKWVAAAKKHTVPQLAAMVAEAKKESAAGENDGVTPSTNTAANIIKIKTFKLHADQLDTVNAAIEKAKKEGNTDTDTVAIEYICLAYLNAKGKNGKVVITEPALKAELTKMGPEKVLEMAADLFPQVDISAEFK